MTFEPGDLFEDEEIRACIPYAFDQDGHPVYFYLLTNFRVFVLKDEELTQLVWQVSAQEMRTVKH